MILSLTCRIGGLSTNGVVRDPQKVDVYFAQLKKGDKGDKGDRGFTGTSAYQHAVAGGYVGTEAGFNAEVSDIANAIKRGSEGYAPMSEINPMQGRYTSITTPKQDNTVKWSGNVAHIGKEPFMIGFACSFNHAFQSHAPAIRFGGVPFSLGSMLMYPASQNENRVGIVGFQTKIDGGTNAIAVSPSVLKPIDKQFYIVLYRKGVDARVFVDDKMYSTTHDRVLEISNALTISNASNFSHLRKFDFADEDFAKSLYNGGRWMEKVIGEEYRSIGETALFTPASWALNNEYGGAVATMGQVSNGVTIDVTTAGTANNRPQITTPRINNNRYMKVVMYLQSVDTICPCPTFYNGTEIISNLEGQVNLNFSINTLTYDISGGGSYNLYFDGRYVSKVKVQELTLFNESLQNEFLPTSICDNGEWHDTAEKGNKLVATNNDKITYNTKPLLQDKLFGANAPQFAPDAIGQEYYDTVGKVKYSAFGTATSADWISQ